MRFRRIVVISVSVCLTGMAIVYGLAANTVYLRLATVQPACAGAYADNTPASFTADPFGPGLDTAPYTMPVFETVSIPSRDADITLSGWYVPADTADAPVVLITHGLGVGTADCRRNPRALMIAGMLHRTGYSVLLIDLRDHGDSTIEDGLWSANADEHRDVLGAWDWLMSVRGFAPDQIGLVGYSGGTGATIIALAQEPRITAAWLDSVYADIRVSIADQLARYGLPTLLIPGGLLIGRLHGDDLTAYSPVEAAQLAAGRPVFITHNAADPVLPVAYAQQLEAALIAGGTPPQMWITQGTGHVTGMFEFTQEYEGRLAAFFAAAL